MYSFDRSAVGLGLVYLFAQNLKMRRRSSGGFEGDAVEARPRGADLVQRGEEDRTPAPGDFGHARPPRQLQEGDGGDRRHGAPQVSFLFSRPVFEHIFVCRRRFSFSIVVETSSGNELHLMKSVTSNMI